MKAQEKMKRIITALEQNNNSPTQSNIIYGVSNYPNPDSGVENLSVWILKDETLDMEKHIQMFLEPSDEDGYQYERAESEHYIFLMFVFY